MPVDALVAEKGSKELETPEELARLEALAQEEDLEKAKIEARDAGDPDGDLIITENLPAPFTFVRRYWGTGPLAYETKRGLIKVASGELIVGFKYHAHDAEGNDLPEELTEVIVMSEEALHAIQDGMPDPPVALSVRAVRIGNERRGTEVAPPIVQKAGESDADFAKRKAVEEKERQDKIRAREEQERDRKKGPLGGSSNPIGGSEPGKGPTPTPYPNPPAPTPKK